MNIQNEIYWHEGLFMQPHHFQILNREIVNGFIQQRKNVFEHHYGFIKSEINTDRLENENIVEFSDLRVLMPSGVYIDINNNTQLQPYAINEENKEKADITLFLGIPFLSNQTENINELDEINPQKRKRLYNIDKITRSDENTGDNPQEILVRKINAKIFTEDDEMDGYETVPLLRLKHLPDVVNNYIPDSNFIPPCFKITGSNYLYNLIDSCISSLLKHSRIYRKEVQDYCEFKSGSVKLQKPMLKLSILIPRAIELNQMLKNSVPTPFDIYIRLRKLIAELSAVISEHDPFNIKEYDHNDPLQCFKDVKTKLMSMLKVELIRENILTSLFVKDEKNIYNLTLSEKCFKNGQDYYICITSKKNIDELLSSIESGVGFKLLPTGMVTGIAVPGIKLQYYQNPSDEIFKKNNEYYFQIDSKSEEWEKIKEEKNISILEKIQEKNIQFDKVELVTLLNNKGDEDEIVN
jgi:type VI secretion system protein ImpJ